MEFRFYFETMPNKGVYCEITSNLVLDVKLQKKIWKWEKLEWGRWAQCYRDLTLAFLFVAFLLLSDCASPASACCASSGAPALQSSVGRQGCGVIRRRAGCSGARGGCLCAAAMLQTRGLLQACNQHVAFSAHHRVSSLMMDIHLH